MSVDATKWAWECRDLSMTQKLVLLSLADRAGENNECWPSLDRLMKDTCCGNVRTIINAIKDLEELGLIVSQKRFGKPNVYHLIGVENRHETTGKIASSESASGKSATTDKSATSKSASSKTATTGKSATSNLAEPLAILPGQPLANLPHESKSKPISEPIKKKIYTHDTLLADLPEDLKADFIAHRKQKRASITETAIKGIRREAEKAGITFADAIRISIERNWQGFVADWLDVNPQPARAHPATKPRTTESFASANYGKTGRMPTLDELRGA